MWDGLGCSDSPLGQAAVTRPLLATLCLLHCSLVPWVCDRGQDFVPSCLRPQGGHPAALGGSQSRAAGAAVCSTPWVGAGARGLPSEHSAVLGKDRQPPVLLARAARARELAVALQCSSVGPCRAGMAWHRQGPAGSPPWGLGTCLGAAFTHLGSTVC